MNTSLALPSGFPGSRSAGNRLRAGRELSTSQPSRGPQPQSSASGMKLLVQLRSGHSKAELVGVNKQPPHCWETRELPHKHTDTEERDLPHSPAKGSATEGKPSRTLLTCPRPGCPSELSLEPQRLWKEIPPQLLLTPRRCSGPCAVVLCLLRLGRAAEHWSWCLRCSARGTL